MDWDSFQYTSTSPSTPFSQLENVDSCGGMGTMLVSFSKDGLICASLSRLTKQELAIAVITATDSSSSCAHRGGDGDAVTVRAVARAAGSRCLRISVATLFLLFSRMA